MSLPLLKREMLKLWVSENLPHGMVTWERQSQYISLGVSCSSFVHPVSRRTRFHFKLKCVTLCFRYITHRRWTNRTLLLFFQRQPSGRWLNPIGFCRWITSAQVSQTYTTFFLVKFPGICYCHSCNKVYTQAYNCLIAYLRVAGAGVVNPAESKIILVLALPNEQAVRITNSIAYTSGLDITAYPTLPL